MKFNLRNFFYNNISIFNIIFLILIGYSIYRLVNHLTVYGLIGFIVSFVVSSLITTFVLNKFKFSNNLIIRLLQKFIFFNIVIFFGFYICGLFNINIIPEASCDGGDDVSKTETTNNTNSQNKSKDIVVVQNESTNLPPTEVSESSVLGSFSEMKEVLNNELAGLSSEQLGCVTNIIGLLMILGGMVTITLILFGEYIIKLLKLDEKYPKLARYIKLRQTFNRYYLIVNFIMIYLIIIIFIGINIYMFML